MNIKPCPSFIVFCTCIGYFYGNTLNGFVIGVLIVTGVNFIISLFD
jgi:hypothetical protein